MHPPGEIAVTIVGCFEHGTGFYTPSSAAFFVVVVLLVLLALAMALSVARPGMTNGSACAWVRGAGTTKGKACRRCEYGWTGPRCTVDELPACRARDGSVDSCVVRKVLLA